MDMYEHNKMAFAVLDSIPAIFRSMLKNASFDADLMAMGKSGDKSLIVRADPRSLAGEHDVCERELAGGGGRGRLDATVAAAPVDAARDAGPDPGEARHGAARPAAAGAAAAQVGGGVGLLPAPRRGARPHAVPEAVGQPVLGPQEDRRVGGQGRRRRAAAAARVLLGHARRPAARQAAAVVLRPRGVRRARLRHVRRRRAAGLGRRGAGRGVPAAAHHGRAHLRFASLAAHSSSHVCSVLGCLSCACRASAAPEQNVTSLMFRSRRSMQQGSTSHHLPPLNTNALVQVNTT